MAGVPIFFREGQVYQWADYALMDHTTCRFHRRFIVAVTDHLQRPSISSDFGRESPAIAPGPPATDLMT